MVGLSGAQGGREVREAGDICVLIADSQCCTVVTNTYNNVVCNNIINQLSSN